MKTERLAPVPAPTYQEICDFAAELLRRESPTNAEYYVEFIYYPTFATPPEGCEWAMDWAKRARARAAAILRKRREAQPRPKLPKPKKPIKYIPCRYWTRRPVKTTRPPPRRHVIPPPGFVPPAAAPPPRRRGAPAERPCRRDRERLIWYDWLFGNQIVVNDKGQAREPAFQRAERQVRQRRAPCPGPVLF